jgi:signal peptidase I
VHDYQRPLIYALFIAAGISSPALSTLYVRQNLLEAFYLPTGSMVPALHRGDRILANKTIWRLQKLKRYDCIVFRAPDHREQNYIKRIIGLPGETVTIDDEGVKVNGQLLKPPGNAPPDLAPGALHKSGRLASPAAEEIPQNEGRLEHSLAPGMCFVLGDNRENSRDSRHFGPVPLGDVIGVAEYVYLPGDSWSRFGTLPQ